MFKKLSTITLAAAALVLSTSAFAGGVTTPAPSNSGFYAGINAGYGKTFQSANMVVSKSSKTGFAGSVDAGYRFNRYVAAEMGVMGNPSTSFKTLGTKVAKSTNNYAVYAAAKGILPLSNGFSLFAKLGPAYSTTKIKGLNGTVPPQAGTNKAIVAFGALGAQYAINPSISLVAQVAGTSKNKRANVPAMAQGTVGVQFNI